MTEALLAVCEELPAKNASGRKAVAQLRSLAAQLEKAKKEAYSSEVEGLLGQLQLLQSKQPELFAKLARDTKQALPGPAAKGAA